MSQLHVQSFVNVYLQIIVLFLWAGIEDDLVIGNVYAEDPDDWDVKDKHYYFFGPWNMAKYFR